MSSLYNFDLEIRKEFPIIAGVDEAGRGPLCGPVSVACVVLKPEFNNEIINDSKKLNEKKREELFDIIIENCMSYSISLIDEATIDEFNILGATLFGMEKCVKELSLTPDLVLIDGNKSPIGIKNISKTVVKGDATSFSIAAASILAKVSRDRYMKALDLEYPQYNLAKHKGYPTKEHYELLEKYGVPSFYRRSFFKKRADLKWIED